MFVIGPLWFVIAVSIIWFLVKAGSKAQTAEAAVLPYDSEAFTKITLDNYMEQLDDFWRESLQTNTPNMARYYDIVSQLQALIELLPLSAQDRFMTPLVARNAEYIAIAKQDKNALKVRLGMTRALATPRAFSDHIHERDSKYDLQF